MKPRAPLPDFDAPSDAVTAAGAWLARRDRGLTAQETAEFLHWLRADPRHEAAFAQLERTFSTFDRVTHLLPAARGEPDPDAFSPRRRRPTWVLPSLAAAGLAAAAALAVAIWQPRFAFAPERHLATDASGYHRAVLSDGSIVELNGDTTVDVEFTRTERRARLSRGEAHFKIAKNPAKPFVVVADSVALRVIGTAFNVRMSPAVVDVVVTEGTVEVNRTAPAAATHEVAATPAPRLTAGQRIIVPTGEASPTGSTIASVTDAEIQRLLAWQSPVAEFHRTPLSDAVAEFNRHSPGRFPLIVIKDDELAKLRIGGSFRLDEPEAFVRLLESSFGVVTETSNGRVVLRRTH